MSRRLAIRQDLACPSCSRGSFEEKKDPSGIYCFKFSQLTGHSYLTFLHKAYIYVPNRLDKGYGVHHGANAHIYCLLCSLESN